MPLLLSVLQLDKELFYRNSSLLSLRTYRETGPLGLTV